MRLLASVVASSALANVAAAQVVAPPVIAPSPPPSVVAPPVIVSSPPPPTVTPLVIAPSPPAPASSSPSLDGPGDVEAKSDFQQSRPVPDGSRLTIFGRYGSAGVYGFAEVDSLHDSTRSFGVGSHNFTLARPRTIAGDDEAFRGTICDSRLGLHLETPDDRAVRGAFVVELGPTFDRFGQGECNPLRPRHFFVAMRTPIVDVLAGRYYSLFGWGGRGFLPNTAAFLGVPGQLYHVEPQVRVSHIFRFAPVDFEVAGALAQPPQSVTGAGEGHFALRLAVNGWRGASAQGGGPPTAAPLQIGISSVGRVFEVAPFSVTPGPSDRVTGGGTALDIFLPLFPAHGDDLGNSLSLTLERSRGSGLADMYTGLTGGVAYPSIPNPNNLLPAPVYRANIEPGIVGITANNTAVPIEWHACLLGAQYHLPIARGRRVWVSGVYSRTDSDNALSLTPQGGVSFVWAHASYYDLNVFVAATPALQLAASYQVTNQVFGDRIAARNVRGQLGATYFF